MTLRHLSKKIQRDTKHNLREAFEDGANRYRNRGILRSAYAVAAAVPTIGLGIASKLAGANAYETIAIVSIPASLAFDQAICAYGNLSGNYKKYGHRKFSSARDLNWFRNRQAALGLNPPHPDFD